MRRDARKGNREDDLNNKIIKYTGITLAILAVMVLGIFLYSKNLNNQVKEGSLTSKQISNIMNVINNTENTENTEATASEIGKSVNEAENEIQNNTNINNTTNITTEKNTVPTTSNTSNEKNIDINNTSTEEKKTEENIDFDMPVEGKISKDFALESLVYSETLQEWTTHSGIDIQADKTTVVKSAEAGTIKTIKNDPRYGLTVTIEHANGFQTIYSNLLTAEFVVEGEKVEKGQSIGTVGNTAAFEIADTPHLHFEMLKDSTYVDPNIYLK